MALPRSRLLGWTGEGYLELDLLVEGLDSGDVGLVGLGLVNG